MLITGSVLLDKYESGVKYKQLEKMYGLTHGQIAGKIYAERIRRKLDLKTPYRPELFNKVDIGNPLMIEGDCIAVMDVHVPTTSYELAHRVIAIAKAHLEEPRTLVIAGDLFNMDIFSHYASFTDMPTWFDEVVAARQLLNEWSEVFSRIYFIMGNHERRATKYTRIQKLSSDLIQTTICEMERPPIVSNFGYMIVNTPTGPWRITHPDRYSTRSLTVASDLAEQHHMNIISGHEHHLSMGMDKNKRYVIINGGGLFDKKQLAYAQLDDGAQGGMQPGFVMLKNGRGYIFGDDNFTDYEMWLK